MRNVHDWDITDLETLCRIKAEENSGLEFKQSAALKATDACKKELCKDVSALANAAGGVVVYGIAETPSGQADYIDDGSDPSEIGVDWIDQVLTSGIEPKIAGLKIVAITKPGGNCCFVVEAHQATVFAPHQVRSDRKYYKRTNRRVEAMLDYEIRDLLRRATAPSLSLSFDLSINSGNTRLACTIVNGSPEPAMYTVVLLTLAKALGISRLEGFAAMETKEDVFLSNGSGAPSPATQFVIKLGPPNHFPIFRELAWKLFEQDATLSHQELYKFHYQIACPGFIVTKSGTISRVDDRLVINEASHEPPNTAAP